jgi:plastocyanin
MASRMNCVRQAVLLVIVLVAFVRSTPAAASIEGNVTLPSIVPASPGASTARYQVKTSGKIAPPEPPKAVVYLEGDFSKIPPRTDPVEMGQRNFQFGQSILVVQKGTKIDFPNYDDGYHNVFSYSKPKSFDLGRYRKDEKPASQVFDKTGVVKLYCEIHEHMKATILVVDTPFFTKTDAKGTYKLENLPAGKYTLKCWIDEKTLLEKPVELKEGETARVDFSK